MANNFYILIFETGEITLQLHHFN